MEDSTSAVTLGVAMKQVEAESRVLSAALAEGAVRDLSHEELGELVAAGRAAPGPDRRGDAGRGR